MRTVISRRQALTGMTWSALRHRVEAGDWQRVFPGAFVTHTGEVSWRERLEAATLARGPGAVVSLHCALHLWGLQDRPPAIITLAEPFDMHRIKDLPGVRVRRRRRLTATRRYGIPVTDVAQTVVDVIALSPKDIHGLMALVTRAVGSHKVSVVQLIAELRHHPRHPARDLLAETLSAAAEGLGSAAEIQYVQKVEVAHGLPRMQRQSPIDPADGHTKVRSLDFRDPSRNLGVEIDGDLWHRERQLADRQRDRSVAGHGGVVLRAGWVEVVATPCLLAGDIAAAQRARGWTGWPRRCGATCAIARDARCTTVR